MRELKAKTTEKKLGVFGMPDDRRSSSVENGSTNIAVMFTDINGVASLYRTIGTSAGSAQIQTINEMLRQVIRTYRGKLVKHVGNSLMALFSSPSDALFAAIAIQKKMTGLVPEHGDPLRLKIAISYGTALLEEQDVFGDAVNIAGKLATYCNGDEILISESFQHEVSTCSAVSFSKRAAPHELAHLGMNSVYCVVWKEDSLSAHVNDVAVSPLSVLSKLFQIPLLPGRARRCFYCGTTAHEPYQCPSKLLQSNTNASDRLCTLPLSRVAEILQSHYTDVTKPLQSTSADERHEIILSGPGDEPLSLCFFTFYETGRLFQLRTILPLIDAAESRAPSDSTGALLLAADCLRVSRHTEAHHWLKRAQQEHPVEYRLLVLRALLNLEQDNPWGALDLFIQAQRSAPDEKVRQIIGCLIARVHEIYGNPEQALQELACTDRLAEQQSDMLFYHGLLLIQSGKHERAIAILRRLVAQNPRHYVLLAVALPTLEPSSQMWAFLDQECLEIRSRARARVESLKKAIREYTALRESDNEALQNAITLSHKADELLQGDTLSGLMDIPGLADEALHILNRALSTWRRQLKVAEASFSKECDRYSHYLAQFPYPRLLASRYTRLKEECLHLCQEVKRAAAAQPPPSAREVRVLLTRLEDATERLEGAMQRLELKKLLCFVLLFLLRLIAVFCSVTVAAALTCSSVLIVYRVYEASFASLSRAVCMGYLKFGVAVGIGVGATAAGFWFAKSFSSRYKKIKRISRTT